MTNLATVTKVKDKVSVTSDGQGHCYKSNISSHKQEMMPKSHQQQSRLCERHGRHLKPDRQSGSLCLETRHPAGDTVEGRPPGVLLHLSNWLVNLLLAWQLWNVLGCCDSFDGGCPVHCGFSAGGPGPGLGDLDGGRQTRGAERERVNLAV